MTEDFKSVYRRGELMGFAEGQQAMAKDMIFYIHRHLGPDMKTNTSLSTKEAYNFATAWVDLLKLEFLKNE